MATYSGISKFSAFDPETGDFIQLNMLSNQSNFEHTLIEDEETTGGGFAGANYRLEIIAGDVTPQMLELFEEWQELKTPLEFFGYGPDFFLQWLQKRTLSIAAVDPANATGGRRKYRILVDFSGITSGIRWGANLLHLVQPWREDPTNPGRPEGYNATGFNNSFENGVYKFDTAFISTLGLWLGVHYNLQCEITWSILILSVGTGSVALKLTNSSNFIQAVQQSSLIDPSNQRFIFTFELPIYNASGTPVWRFGLRNNSAVENVEISNPAIRAGKNHRYIEE